MQTRRNFLRTALLGGSATALMPSTLMAQAANAFQYTPDAVAYIAGKPVAIDLALLGANGEATAGFFATLDPFHGEPFAPGWDSVYGPLLKGNILSTDEDDIARVLTHVKVHGIQEKDLMDLYQKAKAAWDANPQLRTNQGGQAHIEDPRSSGGHTHEEEGHDHEGHNHDEHAHEPHRH